PNGGRRRPFLFPVDDGGIAPPSSDDGPMSLDDYANRNRVDVDPNLLERLDDAPPERVETDPTAAPHFGDLSLPRPDDQLSEADARPREDAGAPVQPSPSSSLGVSPRASSALDRNIAEYDDLASHPAAAKHGRF